MRIYLPTVLPAAGLPVHPYTGLTAIGRRRNGVPIWPVKGGSGDAGGDGGGDGGESGGDGEPAGEGGSGESDDRPLGPAGEKALEAEKTKRKSAQDSLRPWSALARELGVKTPDEIRALLAKKAGADKAKDGDDGDPVDVEKVQREARAAALAEANQRIVRSEVKAAAGGKLADPQDAVRFLDLTEFEVDEAGDVDTDAIAAAIDDLVKKKPYLSAQGGKRFQGSGDGGHRGGGKADPGPGVNRLRAAYAQSSTNT